MLSACDASLVSSGFFFDATEFAVEVRVASGLTSLASWRQQQTIYTAKFDGRIRTWTGAEDSTPRVLKNRGTVRKKSDAAAALL